jgi:hypothetical protein
MRKPGLSEDYMSRVHKSGVDERISPWVSKFARKAIAESKAAGEDSAVEIAASITAVHNAHPYLTSEEVRDAVYAER